MQNYFNPYQYSYGYVNQQPQMQQMNNYPQMTNVQQTYQPMTHQLMYISGLDGARAFIVEPNKTAYLMDSESNTLFVKSADKDGRFTLKSFELNPIDLNDVGKAKNNTDSYATQEQLLSLKTTFFEKLDNLYDELKKVQYMSKYEGYKGDYNE